MVSIVNGRLYQSRNTKYDGGYTVRFFKTGSRIKSFRSGCELKCLDFICDLADESITKIPDPLLQYAIQTNHRILSKKTFLFL